MPTLEEIKANIKTLKAIEENKREIEKLGQERREAEKELKKLQSPRLSSFKRKFFSGVKTSAKFLGDVGIAALEVERRKEAAKRKRPLQKIKKTTSKRKKDTSKGKKTTSKRKR